jgi:hypothetical protein
LSEVLSGDEKPIVHQVIPLIFNLDSFLYYKMRTASQNSFQKDYCSAMSKELNKRYPENGTKVEAYCFSHLLHPFFRGALLNNFEGAWARTQKAFLQQNEVEPEHEPEVIPVAGEEEEEEEEDEFFDAAYRFSQNLEARPSQQGRTEGSLTRLTIELETYLDLPRLNTPKVDGLGWWKAQQHSFPLLAECARKYHCIPASSAPSERLFSASGNLVSQKRGSLNPKNVHMQIYLQRNMEKVKMTKFDFDLFPEAEDEDEEITVLPVAGPGVAGPSK